MPNDDDVRLGHMHEAAKEAISFAAEKRRPDLEADRMLTLALVRLLEIVGEAASRISPSCREAHPEIPWPAVIGMRNRLVHAYFDVDLDVLWETATNDLPPLVATLEKIMESRKPPKSQ